MSPHIQTKERWDGEVAYLNDKSHGTKWLKQQQEQMKT